MRRRKLRWVVIGLAVAAMAVGAFVLWPRPDRITKENYDRIHKGMSRADVEAILGPPNVTASRLDDLDIDEFDEQGMAVEILAPFDLENAGQRGNWLGSQGCTQVTYFQERVVHKGWLPRLSMVGWVRRQWRRWFP